uniref:Uncharacterized protein n=1 Tax=viral metagenome TaxID=1070528 RepID=A0A6C0EMP3_9ZZZZ
MDNIFITTGSKEKCQNWEQFQTPLGLRGKKFRFIILALGTTGSGKTDAIKYAKQYATLINSATVRDNQFVDTNGNNKKWIDIEVSHDHYYTNNDDYKDCINGILSEHHDSENDGDDIINNPETLKLIHDCYQTSRTGKLETQNQKATRRAYGFSAAKKRNNYTNPRGPAIRLGDTAAQRKAKWATSSLGETLHDRELNKFVDPRYAITTRPEEVFNADIVVYKKLTQAVNNGRNIVYESTGVSFDTIKEIIKLSNNACSSSRYNYIIMGVVNIIDKESNIERIKNRFKSDLKKFKVNKLENPAPQSPSTLNSEEIESKQNQIKKNIIELIEYCTCKTKTIWQEKQDIGKTTKETDIFGEKTVTTYQKYGDCDGVGIDLLMLFDQQNVDLRESKEEKKKENVYPSAIIPLSTRSQYLLPLTRTGEGAIVFSANEKKKAGALLGDICTAVSQPASAPEKEREDMMKKASEKPDQLKVEADRIQYRKQLRTKIREKGRGGKKTRKRRKKRTKRKTRKRRKRKKQKTRTKPH